MKRFIFVMTVSEDELPTIGTSIERIMSAGFAYGRDFIYKMEEVDENVRSENANDQP